MQLTLWRSTAASLLANENSSQGAYLQLLWFIAFVFGILYFFLIYSPVSTFLLLRHFADSAHIISSICNKSIGNIRARRDGFNLYAFTSDKSDKSCKSWKTRVCICKAIHVQIFQETLCRRFPFMREVSLPENAWSVTACVCNQILRYSIYICPVGKACHIYDGHSDIYVGFSSEVRLEIFTLKLNHFAFNTGNSYLHKS